MVSSCFVSSFFFPGFSFASPEPAPGACAFSPPSPSSFPAFFFFPRFLFGFFAFGFSVSGVFSSACTSRSARPFASLALFKI